MWISNVLCGLIVIVVHVYSVQGFNAQIHGSNVVIHHLKPFEIPRCRGEYDIALMSFNLPTWIRVQMRVETQNNNDSQTRITRVAFSKVPSHGQFEVMWSSENRYEILLNGTNISGSNTKPVTEQRVAGLNVEISDAMEINSGIKPPTTIIIGRRHDLYVYMYCLPVCNITGLIGQQNYTMFVFRNGTTIPRNSSKEKIDAFVNSWRIQNRNDSLFTYYDDHDFNYYTNDTCPIASTSTTNTSSVHNITTATTTSSVHNTTTSQQQHGSTKEGAPNSGGGLPLHTITTGYIVSEILITLFLANS